MKFSLQMVVVTAALGAVGCQSTANMQWTRIGYGPEFEVAKAQCEIMAMGVEQGMVAWGSPAYVAGAELGNAIGNEIRKAQFFQRCMIIKGWKQVPMVTAANTLKQKQAVAKAKAAGQYFPPPPKPL